MELDITAMPPEMVIFFKHELTFKAIIVCFPLYFQVHPREICLNDFLKVISHNHKTISREDIEKFEAFTAHMGQAG